ncbi:MAG: hypothetical protein CVU61_05065 [Deltaproteobacteria bacterium HGW-Deltaproteobacteria-19]|nr:MAG: hypothetical protein CVU61_05065 [Deltaproteobacteria bacterium HGW-Deltaproteobacteria-19]
MLTFTFLALFSLIIPCIDIAHIIKAKDVEIVLLIASAYWLLSLLTKSKLEYPLINDLINIKRSLIFNKIDLEDSRKRAEIVIIGLKVSEVFQGTINAILLQFQTLDSYTEYLTQKIESNKGKIRGKDFIILYETFKEVEQDQPIILNTLDKMDALLDLIRKNMLKLTFQTSVIVGMDRDMQADIESLQDQVKEVIKQSRAKYNQLITNHEEFVNELKNVKDNINKYLPPNT